MARQRKQARTCEECGRAFQGEMRLCHRCRATDRVCRDCGQEFEGIQNQCSPCLQVKRSCETCGKEYRGTNRRCKACRTIARTCLKCGQEFTDSQQPCSACRKIDRTCTGCGKRFRGHTRHCTACRASERTCIDCGEGFKGEERRCASCSAVERECAGCGRKFRGTARLCVTCWRRTLPPGEQAARARAYGNKRRALKEGAAVAGPVPPEVYYIVRTSGSCVYCGGEPGAVDHVRPLTRGGSEQEDNLVPACVPCNSSKGNRLLTEWRPDRVAYGAEQSPNVTAEYVRLTGREPPHTAEWLERQSPEYAAAVMKIIDGWN